MSPKSTSWSGSNDTQELQAAAAFPPYRCPMSRLGWLSCQRAGRNLGNPRPDEPLCRPAEPCLERDLRCPAKHSAGLLDVHDPTADIVDVATVDVTHLDVHS